MDEDTARTRIEHYLAGLDKHWELLSVESETLIPHPSPSFVFSARVRFASSSPERGVMEPSGDIEFDGASSDELP